MLEKLNGGQDLTKRKKKGSEYLSKIEVQFEVCNCRESGSPAGRAASHPWIS